MMSPDNLQSRDAAMGTPVHGTESIPAAFIDPRLGAQALHLWSLDPARAALARGQHGESVLHWAAMGEVSVLASMLGSAIIDPNTPDRRGRTPLDWLTDRLQMACLDEASPVDVGGRQQIIQASDRLGPLLWAHGGRCSDPNESAIIWARSGCWGLLHCLRDSQELARWLCLGPDNTCVLHEWVHAPAGGGKTAFLHDAVRAGVDVDTPDRHGLTALWHAIAAWHRTPVRRGLWRDAVQALVRTGANVRMAAAAVDLDQSSDILRHDIETVLYTSPAGWTGSGSATASEPAQERDSPVASRRWPA